MTFFQELETEAYKRAAFYAQNYAHLNLPTIAARLRSLPADGWNSGNDRRIEIPAGAKIRLVTLDDAHNAGLFGRDADRYIGLWATEFTYNF